MTHAEYSRKRQWLQEVLKDAVDRGDIYLEYDVKEDLEKLQQQYDGEEE